MKLKGAFLEKSCLALSKIGDMEKVPNHGCDLIL